MTRIWGIRGWLLIYFLLRGLKKKQVILDMIVIKQDVGFHTNGTGHGYLRPRKMQPLKAENTYFFYKFVFRSK